MNIHVTPTKCNSYGACYFVVKFKKVSINLTAIKNV